MSGTVTSLVIGGAAVPLAEAIAELTIRHGLDSPGSGPTSSVLTLALTAWAGPRVRVADSIALDVDGAPRFRGLVSDVRASFDDPAGRVTIQATGLLATLSRRPVRYAASIHVHFEMPEKWEERAIGLFEAVGWDDYVVEPPHDIFAPTITALLAYPSLADGALLATHLEELQGTIDSTVCDLPDGRVLVQAHVARAGLIDWAAVPELPADRVVYAPEWEQTLDIANVAVVGYGNDFTTPPSNGTQTSRNQASVDIYGERVLDRSDAVILDETEAAWVGAELVRRRGYPRWSIPSCAVLGFYTPEIGQLVRLVELPEGSPVGSTWDAIVEGWIDSLAGEEWLTTLILSDPAHSGIGMPWSAVPAGVTWAGLDPETPWYAASTPELLT